MAKPRATCPPCTASRALCAFFRLFRAAAQAARIALLSLPAACLLPFAAAAMEEPSQSPQEILQIIVTAPDITIGANFSGTDFYIAGALENTDPLLRRQNRYDIIAVLEGPRENALLYEKQRRLGVWVNGAAAEFANVPQFYALVSTRELRDITTPQTYRSLGLSADYLSIRPRRKTQAAQADYYKRQLIRLRQEQGLYTQETGAVTFGSPSLFSARFHLPDNIPVGAYKVRAYLFRDGIYTDEAATELQITRKNIAYALYHAAQEQASWYAAACVLIAVFIGLLGRLIFPK